MSRYFEDWNVGDVLVSPSRTVTETDVVQFAQLSGDYNPVHTDEEFAAQTAFGHRIAHGLLGLSILTGLMARLGVFDGAAVALLGIENWRFMAPIHFGDTIHARMALTAKRLASDGRRGVLHRDYELVNQHGVVVQSGSMPLLVKCREHGSRDRAVLGGGGDEGGSTNGVGE